MTTTETRKKPPRLFSVLMLILTLLFNVQIVNAKQYAANRNSSAKTQKLLDYLNSLRARTDRRILTGQMFPIVPNRGYSYATDIVGLHKKTGKYPGILSMDYNDNSLPSYAAGNPYLVDYWNQGGLVSVSCHARNPATNNNAWDVNIYLPDTYTPGNKTYNNWMAAMEKMANGLDELQSQGIVVIWRPFHEMNGGWFWWGNKNDPNDFKKLWIHMFNYFSQTRKLNNLLWVFSVDSGPRNFNRFYPGNDYVDILGMDYYGNNPRQMDKHGWGDLGALGDMPMVMTEYGPESPDISEALSVTRDNVTLLNALKTGEIKNAVYFLQWWGPWSIADQYNANLLMQDPIVVNTGDITYFNDGISPKPKGLPKPTGLKISVLK